MATDNRGGYQPPRRPAPVSGPGRLSRRTDSPRQPVRALTDAAYGEQATYRQDQQGAPMAATPGPEAQSPVQQADLSRVVPLGADTTRPGEPVTAGATAGPGPGPAAMGLPTEDNDPSVAYLKDILPSLELMANMPESGPAFRQFVRRVRAMM